MVADGEEASHLVPADVRLAHLSGHPEIGDKRNLAASMAHGEIIIHWDDDDFSAPGRIADQVARLQQSGKAVTGYHSMRFTDGRRWWHYSGTRDYALGTSLCYRRDWWAAHPFDHVNVGEDGRFAKVAANAGQLISVDAGEMMYATIHPENTSPRQLSGSRWTRI